MGLKNGGPGEVRLLCSFDHESLRTWIKTIVNKLAVSNHTALILAVHARRSYLKLIVNMTFIAYQIKQLVAQRIMVKTTSRSDRHWSAIFCVIADYRPICERSHTRKTTVNSQGNPQKVRYIGTLLNRELPVHLKTKVCCS